MKNTCKKEFDGILWDEIIFGEFIENSEISPDIMKSLDDDIDSIMRELDA
jgi:hypothetical protein